MAKRTKSPAEPQPYNEEPDDRSLMEREDDLIYLATRLAERQLREGTASSQVITHYLKLGSSRERLEQENKELENQLLEAKAEMIRSAQHTEELYAQAIEAMRDYGGV